MSIRWWDNNFSDSIVDPIVPPGDLILVTSRDNMIGTDFIDWGTLGPPYEEWEFFEHPFNILTNLGISATVTMTSTNSFLRINQNNPDPWQGTFNNGDRLIYTDTNDDFLNPISITFETGFRGVGTQIQPNANGPFQARISVYNNINLLLGTFTLSGISSVIEGTAIFIGVRSELQNIFRVDFEIISASLPTRAAFAINRVELSTSL